MLDRLSGNLERYMDLLSMRQKIVASNIANADTPGYKTRDLDFQSNFESAMAGGSPQTSEVAGLAVKNDGNNVSLDREARLLAELSHLKTRYGVDNIQFVDNILDMSFFKTVLPKLAGSEDKYALFYETKANLKREQVELLAQAGVLWIQPGIESLDDRILKLLAKGNSTVMNLQLLKWCCEFGIDVSWNLL